MTRARAWRVAAGFGVWLLVAVVSWPVVFTRSSAQMVVASHDAVVRPRLDGRVQLALGPYLPDVRFPSGRRAGVSVEIGKTTAAGRAELVQRYATIAAAPEAEVRRVTVRVREIAIDAAVIGLVPVALWALIGRPANPASSACGPRRGRRSRTPCQG